MFDPVQITETLALHQKSYELLRWVAANLRNGALDFGVAHEAASGSEAAREWVSRHWQNLPQSVRPIERQLDAFAHLFSSYLTTSFRLVENPAPQKRSYCGCFCSYAMVTYVQELVRRTQFASQGEGVLALWRQFAWNNKGSVKPKFKLTTDAVMQAEQAVLSKVDLK